MLIAAFFIGRDELTQGTSFRFFAVGMTLLGMFHSYSHTLHFPMKDWHIALIKSGNFVFWIHIVLVILAFFLIGWRFAITLFLCYLSGSWLLGQICEAIIHPSTYFISTRKGKEERQAEKELIKARRDELRTQKMEAEERMERVKSGQIDSRE